MIKDEQRRPGARGRLHGRRARVAISYGLGGFLLAQAALALVLQMRPAWRDPFYACRMSKLHDRVAAAGDKAACVVMLGSSRTEFGLNGPLLEKCLSGELGRPAVAFNFGRPATAPLCHLLAWQRLLRDGVRPDLLLVEVHPGWLGDDEYDDSTILKAEALCGPEIDMLQRHGTGIDLHRAWLAALPVPWYSQRIALAQRFCPWLLPKTYHVHYTPPAEAEQPSVFEESQRVRALKGASDCYKVQLANTKKLGRRQCAALGELLASCRDHGVSAALVLMPEGPTFRSWYAPEFTNEIDAFLYELRRDCAVPVIDAREWVEESLFMDSHHLLADGAARFTERLAGEILPLLRKNAHRPPDGVRPRNLVKADRKEA